MPALTAGETYDWNLFYSSYLQTYLERDVRDLAQVGDNTTFARFLAMCGSKNKQIN